MLKSIFNPNLFWKQVASLLTLVLLFASLSFANIIRVPQDVSTIQAALDSCSAGDTVLVSPGTYNENIVWPNTSSICLMSEYGRDTTIIRGSGTGSVIKLSSISDSTTVISGFTIRNGNSSLDGGGIYCIVSSPIIRNNLIDSNRARYGGGIACAQNSNPKIIGNIIRENSSSLVSPGGGGGIFCLVSAPFIDSNIVSYNQGYGGGGIYCKYNSPATIINNEVSNNTGTHTAGIRCNHGANPLIMNNLVQYNSAANDAGGIGCHDNSAPLILKNIIQYNYGDLGGGGIGCHNQSSPEIRENTIMYNETNLTNGYGGGIDVYIGSPPHIVKNVIGYNKSAFGGGISCENNCNPNIDSNCIMHNSGDGIHSAVNSNPVINYNNIFGNSHYGVHNSVASLTINAENNWWGDASGPYHPDSNSTGQGDTVSDYVDFTPYLADSVDVVGIKNIQKVIPENFVLYQNYPNPFNPTTYIRFDVHNSSHIKLVVYDILGKEITTLVNQKLRAGSYEVDWDGKGYPSGVYFYRLVTEDYIDVKKMILIK